MLLFNKQIRAFQLLLGVIFIAPNSFASTSINTQIRTISHLETALYIPPNCSIRGDIILFSGKERNYVEYRNAMQATAEKLCLRIYSPYFDKKKFPPNDYQRGGASLKLIPAYLSSIKKDDGVHIPYFMIGHSAGGQFLERLIAYQTPLAIQKFIVISPSSYVFPSLKIKEPYGFLNHSQNDLKIYLQQSLTILVGEKEGQDTPYLLHNKEAMMQGNSRLERGEKTFSAAQEIAKKYHISLNWSFSIMHHIGHNFKESLHSEEVKKLLEESLISFEKNLYDPKLNL